MADRSKQIAELAAIADECRKRAASLDSTSARVSRLTSATTRAIGGTATGDDAAMLGILGGVAEKTKFAAAGYAEAGRKADAAVRQLREEQRAEAKKSAARKKGRR